MYNHVEEGYLRERLKGRQKQGLGRSKKVLAVSQPRHPDVSEAKLQPCFLQSSYCNGYWIP